MHGRQGIDEHVPAGKSFTAGWLARTRCKVLYTQAVVESGFDIFFSDSDAAWLSASENSSAVSCRTAPVNGGKRKRKYPSRKKDVHALTTVAELSASKIRKR